MSHTDEVSSRNISVCNICTFRLVNLCYQRAWWFRMIREPLLLGMRIMAWWHEIDPRRYRVRNPDCYGCIRFMKNALKEKSFAFRLLNRGVDPVFNSVRNSLLTHQEIEEARSYAREATKELIH
jgi:hypothetical protein